MDGFCFFGLIGKCGSETYTKTVQTRQLEVLNSFVSEKIVNTLSEQRSTLENMQIISIESGGDILLMDINLKQYADLKSDTNIKIEKKLRDESNISDMIDALAKVNLDIKNETSGILSGSAKTFTESEVKIISEIKNQFINKIQSVDTISCINSAVNQQTINLKASGNVTVKSVNMEQTGELVAKCYTNIVLDIFKKIDLSNVIKDNQETTIGVANKAEGLSIWGAISSFLGPWLWPIIIIIISVILIPIIGVIIVGGIYLAKRKQLTINPQLSSTKIV